MTKLNFLPILLLFTYLNAKASNHFIEAGKAYGLNPKLLWAIAYKESRHNPKAINRSNKNGTYDIGIMQINSMHLKWLKKDYGISEKDLLEKPRINIFAGATILKKCFDKYGANIKGLTCYNGKIKSNPYGKEVLEILAQAQKQEEEKKRVLKMYIVKKKLEKKDKEFIKIAKNNERNIK
ncbi:lytic transglycosylase domain-containing protein [Campylobacter sp. MIT 97-5078]|uniref:lytic transglycosylase domain-containing protein n=1 Tax=Campylobacter sp. MIT 97-5078 TaxID=1548153 RepID=UPI0009DD6745|nr:lytic transglycosylase domain-containing protein [Campylobacter sp. MIT 97-5078]TQR25581.1 twitching motility protein PilT [Campylobacter sp. MIT 97-5078]